MPRPPSSNILGEGSVVLRQFLIGQPVLQKPLEPSKELQTSFKIGETSSLPRTAPPFLDPPFRYFSRVNADASYLRTPRLSVTRLLVSLWCELRDFYRVYAGSPRQKATSRMKQGTQLHLKLERETHKEVATLGLLAYLAQLAEKSDPKIRPSSPIESELAQTWCDGIMDRLYTLVTTSEAREVLTHGYLDLESGKINSGHAAEHGTLVSGVIDLLRIINPMDPHDYSLFEEIQNNLEYDFGDDPPDMDAFFETVSTSIAAHKTTFSLQISDVKTRGTDHAPHQKSVVEAARFQVGIYRKLTEILANDAYEMLLHNARVRHADVDKPIEFEMALVLLRKYPHLLYHDFRRLAAGKQHYTTDDDHKSLKSEDDKDADYRAKHQINTMYTRPVEPPSSYRLGDFIPATFVDDMSREPFCDGFDYSRIITKDIANSWKTPLTLRHFAARSADFFRLLLPLLGPITSVEYHNSRTGMPFDIRNYKYNDAEIDAVINDLARFWSGKRNPRPADDFGKCKYCEFFDLCSVPHPNLEQTSTPSSVGARIAEYVK